MNVFFRHRVKSIRFRRWSRKAYAMFLSVGRCVTIGCVSKSITDASLAKNRRVVSVQAAAAGHRAEDRSPDPPDEDDIGSVGALWPFLSGWSDQALHSLCRPEPSCSYGSFRSHGTTSLRPHGAVNFHSHRIIINQAGSIALAHLERGVWSNAALCYISTM